MSPAQINARLDDIFKVYGKSFEKKIFGNESAEVDDLMKVFGLTQKIKMSNKQYWGRELGMCWQKIICELFEMTCKSYNEPIRDSKDEICDLVADKEAIDTKYRIGSGDSGTLKKFKQYGKKLKDMGYKPILLILRTDNLPAAITACKGGGWTVYVGEDSYQYVKDWTGFDLKKWLKSKDNAYRIKH